MGSTSCKICGRPLTNPASVAAGIGPICGGRSYASRIYVRHGFSGGGWSELEEWEKVNNPCYSCKSFKFPGSKEERQVNTGNMVSMSGEEKVFARDSIGGMCKCLKRLVDGNVIEKESACGGTKYKSRKKPEDQPKVGLLFKKDQVELHEI